MTEIIINSAIVAAALYGASHTPWIKRRLGGQPAKTQNLLFKVMIGVLYAFSLHETIDEDGFLYGVTFSLIPLVAGAVVLSIIRSRQTATSQPAPILGPGIVPVISEETSTIL